MRTARLFTGLALVCVGCATTQVRNLSVTDVAAKSTMTRDDSKRLTTVSGTKVFFGKYDNDLSWQQYQLISQKWDNRAAPSYFVAIISQRTYREWAFWKEVSDSKGNRFPLNRDSQDVYTQNGIEHASVHVGRDYLEDGRTSGLAWKLYGEKATQEFTIEAKVIEAFLLSCDQMMATNLAILKKMNEKSK
jgi:hypothetical protein